MTGGIHKTAIIGDNVKISDGVSVGPYSILSGNIIIGEGTTIDSHVHISGDVEIGKNNRIYPFCSIGTPPQDIQFKDTTLSKVQIGDNNIIREYVTINGGGDGGNYWKNVKNITIIGNNCYLYISCHIAHDVVLENNVTITNLVGVSGHVLIEDNVIVGGMSGIHQHVKIGKNCMIGGMSPIGASIPPFCLTSYTDANKIFSLNIIGLRRYGFTNENIKLIAKIYNNYFKGKIKADVISKLDLNFNEEEKNSTIYKEIHNFFTNINSRGLIDISDRIVNYGF